MPHFAGLGPFGKLDFRNQRRLDPGRHGFILYLCRKWRLGGFERRELTMKLLQSFMAEACADMADIPPARALQKMAAFALEP